MVVAAGSVYSGSLLTSGTWTTARVKIARPLKAPRLGGRGYACLTAASRSGSTLWCAARCKSCPSKRITRPLTASHSRAAFAAMASNTGWMSPGELLMTRRISLVAVCCSCASVKERCKSAYGGAGWALPSGCRKGVPHSSQNFAAARFSCWHRGHVMPQPPSSRGGGRSEPWLRLTAQDSHGQEPGPRGHAWGQRAGWASPSSPVAQPLKWTQLITQAATGLSPETVRRGGERDRCGTALLGGSNPVTTRIVRRVSRKQFAVLDCGSDQHFRHT